MSRGELAIVAGVILCAIGAGLWIHPGAGAIVAGLGLGTFGVVELRFPDAEEEPTAAREDLAA